MAEDQNTTGANADQASSAEAAAAGRTPAWRTGAFAGEFGDAFISDTELEGGQVAPSIETLVRVIRAVLSERARELTAFGDDHAPSDVERICDDLLDAAARDRRVAGIGPARRGAGIDNEAFASLLERFVKRLAALEPGQRVCVSGGWAKKSGGHAVMHVVEREPGGTYAMVTCNTGDGLQYHPSHDGDYPKQKQKTAMRFGGIPPERALEPSLWYMFFGKKSRAMSKTPQRCSTKSSCRFCAARERTRMLWTATSRRRATGSPFNAPEPATFAASSARFGT